MFYGFPYLFFSGGESSEVGNILQSKQEWYHKLQEDNIVTSVDLAKRREDWRQEQQRLIITWDEYNKNYKFK